MKRYALIFIIAALASACMDKDLTTEDSNGKRPEVPTGYSIDIDSDSKSDLIVEYKELQTTDVPSSGGSIIGSIRPINEYQLLYFNDVGSLFLKKNDTIKPGNGLMTNWNSFPADLVTIHRHDNKWDNHWKILSGLNTAYFLAFKNDDQIGYLQLQIDTLKGEIKVLDKMISTSNELIIKE